MTATTKAPARLMTHMVAYFPTREASLDVAAALAEGGASYLEVQFPFSDPSADGGSIQSACTRALDQGFTVDGGFALVAEIAKRTGIPIFIMSYGNLVFRRGIDRFVEGAKAAGAGGLIVPDLMPGYDERLFAEGARQGMDIVPVVAPSISDERLSMVTAVRPAYLYAALRVGITGSYTEIGESNRLFLQRLERVGAKILAGFGIRTHEQVAALSSEVHALIVGSALVELILEATEGRRDGELHRLLAAKVRTLLNGDGDS